MLEVADTAVRQDMVFVPEAAKRRRDLLSA